MEKRKQKRFTKIIFGVYLALLVWLVLFKLQLNITDVDHIRSVNLNPFQGVDFLGNGFGIREKEAAYNIVFFIPFGVYLSMLKPDWSFWKRSLCILLTSLGFEVVQYIFALGVSDITDLLGNTLGGILGTGIFYGIRMVLKEKTEKVINILSAIAMAALLAFYLLLLIVNL